MRSRARGATARLLLGVIAVGGASASCTTLPASSAPGAVLAGSWQGWVNGRLGNGPATLVIKDTGAFSGAVRLADGDHAFAGRVTIVGGNRMRYGGSMGDGIATLVQSGGEETLRLVPDGGGGIATFVRAKP